MDEKLAELKRLADDPAYATSFPGQFVEYMGLRGASQEYLGNAWELFKQARRPISPQEVVAYAQGKKGGEDAGVV